MYGYLILFDSSNRTFGVGIRYSKCTNFCIGAFAVLIVIFGDAFIAYLFYLFAI